MFEKELKYYNANKSQLYIRYKGKHIVIVGEHVIGTYDDAGSAYTETAKTIPPGSFMIREIPENIEDEVQYILHICISTWRQEKRTSLLSIPQDLSCLHNTYY